jgi:hypothetical protein
MLWSKLEFDEVLCLLSPDTKLAPQLDPVLLLTLEPADDDDELNEIIELGRLDDFISGSVPINEFRNLGAEIDKSVPKIIIMYHLKYYSTFSPFPNWNILIERSLI